jgi:hypothetical protein
MAVTAFFYGNAFVSAFNGEIDFNSDTIKVMLCTSGYTPNQDTHAYKTSVTSEVTGTGYTAGGAVLGTATVTYDAASNTLKLDGDNAVWSSSTITARYAVVYDDSPATAATKPLIAYVDFGADVSSSAGTFTITWDAAGIATVTVA